MIKSIQTMRAEAAARKGDFEGAANLFIKANEESRAADMYMHAGLPGLALRFYEKCGNLPKAVEAAREAGDFARAAKLLEVQGDNAGAMDCLLKAGDEPGAVKFCIEHGMKIEAAVIYAERGQRGEAAKLFFEAKEFNQAIELFRKAGDVDRMVSAYLAREDPEVGAEECLQHEEWLAAGVLFETAEKFAKAARAYEKAEVLEQAAQMYERAGELERLGNVRKSMGRLDLATAAYADLRGHEAETADLFARLVVLESGETHDLGSVALCGAVAQAADALVVGLASRIVRIMTRSFKLRFEYRLSGDMTAAAVALSPDGKLVAIGADGSRETAGSLLMLLDENKRAVFQMPCSEVPRRILFSPDETSLVFVAGGECVCVSLEGEEVWRFPVDFMARALDLSPAGDLAAVGTLGGKLYLLNSSGKVEATKDLGDRVQAVRFDLSGKRIAALVGDNRFIIFDSDLKVLHDARFPFTVRNLEGLPGNAYLALSYGKNIGVFDWTGEQLSQIEMSGVVVALFSDPVRLQMLAALDDKHLVALQPQSFQEQAADYYTRAGKLKEAAAIYEQIEAFDKAYDLFRQLGEFENAARVMYATGDVVRAARHYEMVGRHEQAARLYEGAGEDSLAARCYGRAGDTRKAAEIYEKLGDLILAADFHEQHGDFKQAASLFKRTLQVDNAVGNFEAWLALHPDDMETIFELGDLYASERRNDDAIRMLQRLTDNEQYKREALRLTGECFLQKGLPDVAINRFEEAIGEGNKPARENIDLFYDIGLAHEAAERFDAAAEVFGRVMAIDYYFRDIQERLNQSKEMSALIAKPDVFDDIDLPTTVSRGQPKSADKSEGFERYRILRKLGQGGMGVVYLAMDERLHRQVAWKVLPSHLSGDAEFQQRLLREARAVAQLFNPHIVAIYDIVTDPSECYITMEYIEGETLRQKLKSTGRLSTAESCRIGIQIAEALAVAHDAGIVHRDVKPENIMIAAKESVVKMVDFGLAHLGDDQNLTREGVIAGTLAYMSPEQIRAESVDGRADIYALGLILYEMMAGSMAYTGENVLGQHLHGTIPDLRDVRSDAPGEYAELVMRCLVKDKEERVAAAREVIVALTPISQAAALLETTRFQDQGSLPT
ncbi:hypothetical protein CVU37_03260 [candidate division BRC1 bacterium HGW-BRC1-1]|jgi:tetratricopeptide (TPR) repeat protein|nr:MAG: hypothetical protein CVU37_03260 [candidate division BRC1 bacterium HGW-BRC1-1]